MTQQCVRAVIIRNDKLLTMERHKGGQHYFALLGGAIDPGESEEQALVRELHEEANLTVERFRHVFTEDMGKPFGTQYIYLCDDPGGEPSLRPDSIEAELNARGEQSFELAWLPLALLDKMPLMSPKMKAAIIGAVKNTFPDTPELL